MPYFDLPLDELRRHATDLGKPEGLDQFWADTIAENDHNVETTFVPTHSPLTVLETFDVSYSGCGGDRISAWLHLPANRDDVRLPCVVEYIGYGGGRGLSHQHVFWAAAGYAHFVMDTRGQGAAWSVGHTPDPNSGANAHPGFLTRGILDPGDYYYRRVYVDAVRAIDAARAHPAVDPEAIAVAGISQGGGLSLAVAALRNDVVAALPEVPFLADMRRATELVDTFPYSEISAYLRVHRDRVETAFQTLSYFDVALLTSRATAPALFSVGLMDTICPPSTVYAAFNAYGGPKDIIEYTYNDHEGGGELHQVSKAAWLRKLLDDSVRTTNA